MYSFEYKTHNKTQSKMDLYDYYVLRMIIDN